ncbi:hypothetical protein ACFWBF_28525 [Streptomyces sp. NPDC060028]|uniref:hypothetical protein n=1 Tax=Streptomyces sp. NPDC060028 TaxID=3347041 RepID=UPI0036929FD8
MTRGMTVRELAQRFGAGRTAWSEYRSGARVIPLGRLGIVVEDRVRDPRRRRELLARARWLHGQALTAQAEAEAAATVPRGLEDALRRAQNDLAASGQLVEGLLVLMTMLQEQAKVAPPDRPDPPDRPEDDGAEPARKDSAAAASGPLRFRPDQALDQLIAAREARKAVRQAVAEARSQGDAARRDLRLPALAAPDQPPRVDGGGDALPAATADRALSVELARLHSLVEQQREDAHWLWERTRAGREPSGTVQAVVLERLDRLPAVPARAPLPVPVPPQRLRTGRSLLAALAACTVLAVVAAALAGVLVGRQRTVPVNGATQARTHSRPVAPRAAPTPSASPTPSPTPSGTASPVPSGPPFSAPQPSPSTAGPTPGPTAPAPPPAQQSPGSAYAVSPDHRSVLRWTARDGAWKVIGPAADQVYAGSAGVFTTSPGDGRIFKHDEASSSWSQIGAPGEQFVVAGESLYAITEQRNAVMRWTGLGAEWVPIGGAATRLYAGGAGLFATNPDTGGLFRYAGYGFTWLEAGGPGADFAVGPDYVARISVDGKEIWQANAKGSNWRPIGGPARNLYAGGAGLFAVDAATGQILKYDGAPGSWSPIGTAGVSLAVGSDSVYRVDSRLEVSRWTGSGTQWTSLGLSAGSIAASG